jgi:hypothetical protein
VLVPFDHYEAFIEVPKAYLSVPITDQMKVAIRQISPEWNVIDANLTLKEFSLYVEEFSDSVIFQLAANYSGRSGRIAYDAIDSDSLAMWMYFINQFGFVDANLMTTTEKNARVKELRGW